MSRQDLAETLKELHQELSRSTTVDEELRTLLREVSTDIERLLEGSSEARASGGEPEEPWGGVSEEVAELAARIEGDHPQLAQAVRRVVAALSAMGI